MSIVEALYLVLGLIGVACAICSPAAGVTLGSTSVRSERIVAGVILCIALGFLVALVAALVCLP